MIPSDHFVRFYNEVFKFLDKQSGDGLSKYWLAVSKLQENFCLENFQKDGLRGMYDYWNHIRIEENCDMTLKLNEDFLELIMHKCPSLSKVQDNDAEPCAKYCEHCVGWIGPIISKCNYYMVCDIHGRNVPTCHSWIFFEKIKAEQKKAELNNSDNTIFSNF